MITELGLPIVIFPLLENIILTEARDIVDCLRSDTQLQQHFHIIQIFTKTL